MAEYDLTRVGDLTQLTDSELNRLDVKTSIPYVELKRHQKAQQAQKAAEEEYRRRRQAADEQLRRQKEEWIEATRLPGPFADALDQLLHLSTPALPERGFAAVNGPEVAALLMMTQAWLDGEIARVRTGLRDRLRDQAAEFNWDLDYLVDRFMAAQMPAVAAEVDWSQGQVLVLGKGLARTEAEASVLLNEGAMGHKIPHQVRSRSRRGKKK
jgi:hypothetical protein